MKLNFLLLCSCYIGLVRLGYGHVSLTYPPADYPNYDFLDNARTKGPCGIPLGTDSPGTTLKAGSKFNATFHLAYPHRGGFSFDILNASGHLEHKLTGIVSDGLATDQEHEITLPAGYTCNHCYFRLTREANEWEGPESDNKKYLFWSCASVKINNASDGNVCCGRNCDCSGHGQRVNNSCQCKSLYYGDCCQYKDQCDDDAGCSSHGTCVDLESTSPPRHQCFCNAGWMGPTCEKATTLSSPEITDITRTRCRGYFAPKDNLEICYEPVNNNQAVQVSMKYTFDGNGPPEWLGFGFKPTDVTLSCQASSPGWNPNKATTGAIAEENDNSDGDGVGWAEGEGVGMHPMDCTDMVIVKVKGDQSRILDHYTRDRSTPQEDEWYGGSQDLIGASGKVLGNVMVASFIKPRRSNDRFDHNITNSTIYLLWAHGQVIGKYKPTIPTAAASQVANFVFDFYRPLELKYHGMDNKGFWNDNLLNPKPPTAGYCSAKMCDAVQKNKCYSAEWGYLGDNKDKVLFKLKSNSQWAAIGFSDDREMPDSDVVTGFVNNGDASILDRWASARAQPVIDANQTQLGDKCAAVVNNETVVVFSRSVQTSDVADLPLNRPLYFLFAWGDLVDGKITYHGGSRRFVSDDKINATECRFTAEPQCSGGVPTTSTSCAIMMLIAVVSLILNNNSVL